MQASGRRNRRLAVIAGLAMLASGCTAIHDHRGFIIDQQLVDSVQPGVDNRTSVERTLGRPTFASQFGDPAWYYVSVDTRQLPFGAPHTTQETVLRVRFDTAGNVAGIDRAGMQHVVRIHANRNFTPTLGHKRSFLEGLFGNIGSVGAAGLGGPTPDNTGGGGTGPNGS